ncbi:MAG: adenylate/guanylate cyclase domain-containing protein, partial [Anaerolineae bacterium]|nr:adenylate/guanylate cyclase domain-containing protein [Anaerolineae bacterium]
MGTETWVELMNRVLHILEREIERFGGLVEQFRGDGLVAFFGATVAHEDDPERAVLAALAMQDAIHAFAPEVQQQHGIALKLRVGVNTGEIIVAAPGERRPHSEIAMGIAISVADRMEGAATPGTVLVSDDTYRLVETQFEWQSLGEITVQGIAQPIAVHRPLRAIAATEDDPQLSPALQADIPMIGRDEEFQTLRRAVNDVLSGRGRIVLLTGEKGLGKSFLINQLREYYAHRAALLAEADANRIAEAAALSRANGLDDALAASVITSLRGRCRSYHQGWPFSMWIDALQSWLGVPESTKEELRDALRGQSETLWGESFADHYP